MLVMAWRRRSNWRGVCSGCDGTSSVDTTVYMPFDWIFWCRLQFTPLLTSIGPCE